MRSHRTLISSENVYLYATSTAETLTSGMLKTLPGFDCTGSQSEIVSHPDIHSKCAAPWPTSDFRSLQFRFVQAHRNLNSPEFLSTARPALLVFLCGESLPGEP